jgi:hypothetical protein
MMTLTLLEQKLIIEMGKKPLTSMGQKVYASRVSFYKSMWKMRDADIVRFVDLKVGDRHVKEWRLTMDGQLLALIISKTDGVKHDD